jgi:hypothetical protein
MAAAYGPPTHSEDWLLNLNATMDQPNKCISLIVFAASHEEMSAESDISC